MAKFNKKKSDEVPPISTASLPDIIFMLLFFFMTVTQTKDGEIKVANDIPSADQVQKLDKKDPVIYVYAGEPLQRYQDKFGKNAKLQINDVFVDVDQVGTPILKYKEGLQERYKDVLITSLKIDKHTKMGIIGDLKEQLREINALKINYITKEGKPAVLGD